MKNKVNDTQSWQGKNIQVKILFSVAGIAQHIWISNNNSSILIDTGDGVLRDLLSKEIEINRIKGIFFTHGHFDHMGGIHSLLGFFRMTGRKELLSIITPKNCTEVYSIVNNFKECYPDSIPFEIDFIEADPNEEINIAGMSVKAYPVVHCGSIEGSKILKPIPAMGYRISVKGEIIAVSGDTGLCPSLKELVKGADLAIIEATLKKHADVSQDFLTKVHLSEDLAIEIGKLAKEYILVHTVKKI